MSIVPIQISANLKNKIEKCFKDYGIPSDLLDITSEYDEKISEEENFNAIENKIKILSSSKDSVEKENTDFKRKKKSVKNEKEQQEMIKFDNLKKEVEHTQTEFKKSLEQLQESNSVIEKLYWLPKQYIQAVANPNNDLYGLIETGQAGISKSFSTIQTLNEISADYVYFSGYTTPLGLYEFLYHNRQKNKIVVFDDTFGILNNTTSIMLMLNALYSSSGVRKIFWSSSRLKDIPSEFLFEANIILITNKLPNNIGSDLINSRCLNYEFKFNNKEILSIMKAIAKMEHKKLKKEERLEIVNFIEENTDETTKNFDLRVQNKIEQLYLYNNKTWKELSKPLLKRDEELFLLKEVIKKCSSIAEAQKEYNRELQEKGYQPVCVKTFYNKRRELLKR